MDETFSDPLTSLHKVAPNATDNAIKNLTDEPTKFCGKTSKSILDILFGSINYYAEGLDFKRKLKLLKFKETCIEEIFNIDEENRIAPPLEIAGPIVDASRFYFDNDTLSELFSNLLVSSCDVRKIKSVHPAYVKILEQMSVLDAKVIKSFESNNEQAIVKYVIDIIFKDYSKGLTEFQNNVFYINAEYEDIDVMAASITNLERLGLLNLDYQHKLLDEGAYSVYEKDPNFLKYTDSSVASNQQDILKTHTNIIEGIVYLTPFGKQFLIACVRK